MPDSKLQVQVLHDRVMAPWARTAQVARRLSWGEVYGVGQHVRTVEVDGRAWHRPLPVVPGMT